MKRIILYGLLVIFGITLLAVPNIQAQEPKFSGFFRQRTYYRWDWDFDEEQNDVKQYYEGLLSFTAKFPVTRNVDIGVKFSEFFMWGMAMSPTIRPFVSFKDLLEKPVDLDIGCLRLTFGRGYLLDVLGLNSIYARVKFPPYTLKALAAKDEETMIAGRDEDFQFAGIGYRADIGEVEAAVYRLQYIADETQTRAYDLRADLKFGKFHVQAEGVLEQGGRGPDVDLNATGGYATVKYTLSGDLAPFIGGSYFIMSGDDPETADEYEGFDKMYNPVFLGINYGEIAGRLSDHNMTNIRIINAMAGFKPRANMSVAADFFMNTRDQVPNGVDEAYGNELRAAFTYKYTRKISWTLMFSTFMPGEYFGEDLDPAYEVRGQLMYLL